jgi:hypothetical protein
MVDYHLLAFIVAIVASLGALLATALLSVYSWRELTTAYARYQVRRQVRRRLNLIRDGRL